MINVASVVVKTTAVLCASFLDFFFSLQHLAVFVLDS